jgi:hypothetical protein
MSIHTSSTKVQRGVAIIEFTFSLLFLIPLMLGVLVFGFKFIRGLEMIQVSRDLGAMYLRGVDFRNAGAQQTAQRLADNFNLTATGTSVVILSTVKLITGADCLAANKVANPGSTSTACTNLGKAVFTEQLTVGNPAQGSSAFNTPPTLPATCTPISTGTPCVFTVTVQNQGITAGAQAANFAMVLKAGELAYVAEMVNLTPAFTVPGLSGAPQVYARAIF